MSAALEVRNLTKDFVINKGFFRKGQAFRAVNNVSFSIDTGRAIAIVGESGCGKSTLARLICQMAGYTPTSGEIAINGKVVEPIKTRQDRIDLASDVQMIFQDPYSALNPVHTIGWHLDRAARNQFPNDKKKREQIAIESLEACGLTPAKDVLYKHPFALSGGQRQRVCIARVIATGAQVILADEPTSMLDVSIRIGVLKLLDELKGKIEASFVYITHDLASARFFADDIVVMYSGHVVEKGPTQAIIENPRHPYTQLLLASVPDPDRESSSDKVSDVIAEAPMWSPDTIGCPFWSRCPKATDRCNNETPQWRDLDDRQVFCHYVEE
ncbi:ABC transporter ATP-binding protein [Vibrio sp. DW001]|uniref:ABC transporter ATP-binding protein n=1 Tax=Vibrio sp. DW001 TaxID=2912315 RepID=UPI0023AF58FD|nr:ABC transporter ATP-binding protein [Vibrio sp. DW001]WED27836.1 ABC transporter ATP-binding protein [Vibrio sp. DW001]